MKQRRPTLQKSARRLKSALLAALLMGAAGRQAAAQEAPVPAVANPNVMLEDTITGVRLEQGLDSLAAEPLEPAIDSARLVWLRTPPSARDIVCDRVGCFETDVPHQFNNAVMAYVNLFTLRNRSYMQRVLERENLYFPLFEKYLAKYNLPTDLKYLAVVESALIPTAKSPVGAVGLWQFMPPTAGDLRLHRDEWVDERMHPEKATEAACKHLRYLYGVFHDWELVLAAYNWGAGNMQRVMRRSGKHNFWDLYPYMPAETRNYVPTFTAIMYTMKYAQQHQLHDPALRYQYYEPLDTLTVTGQPFDLRRLSRACGYDDSTALQRFNPELRRAALPAGYRPYVVRFPSAARPHLGEADRATLLDFCRPLSDLPQPLPIRMPRLEGVEPFPVQNMLAAESGPRAETEQQAQRFRRLRHTVRRGETVASVAERYEVSPAQVRRWNELAKGHALKPGRQLVVFVPLPVVPASPAAKETTPTPPVPRPVADEAAQRLAAANTRYAKEVAEANARAAAQAEQLARLERAHLARQAAERQRLARAQAAEARAQQLAQAKAAAAAAADSAEEPAAVVVTTAARPAPRAERPERTEVATKAEAAAKIDRNETVYTVRPGDYLTRLARERGLSVSQLVEWNHLKSETVIPGQKLMLVAPAEAADDTNSTVAAGKARPAAPTATATKASPAKSSSVQGRFHQVQPGDTLYNISRRFGISVDELRKLNQLTSDEVKLGQKLLVQQG